MIIAFLLSLVSIGAVETTRPSTELTTPTTMDAALAEEVGAWMMHYYRHPEPREVARRVKEMSRAGLLGKEDSSLMTAAFWSRVFADNNEQLAEWADVIDTLSPAEQKTMWRAVHWSQADAGRELLRRRAEVGDRRAGFLKKLLEDRVPDFKAMDRPSPQALDACWSLFFASGDSAYVETVVRCALRDVEGELRDVGAKNGKLTTADIAPYAARWSVVSLCEQDDRVKEVVERFRREKATPEQLAVWDDRIKRTEPQDQPTATQPSK